MDILYKKIYEIREKPIIYIGKKSIALLRAFIDGYIHRQHEIDKNYKSSFYNFSDFVKKYYLITSNQSWCKVITFFTRDEEEAFDTFYIILDKFMKEYEKQDEIYMLGTIMTHYEHRPIKEIHYTNHGNAKRFRNPHEHDIKWLTDNTYYFDDLHGNPEELYPFFERKDNRDHFFSKEEFVNTLLKGGEIEFAFNENKYSITYPERRLCLTQIGDNFSEVFYEGIEELLDHKIDNQKMRDIVTVIEPYFRRF